MDVSQVPIKTLQFFKSSTALTRLSPQTFGAQCGICFGANKEVRGVIKVGVAERT